MSRVFVFTATKMEGRIVERMMRAKTHPPDTKTATIGEIGDNKVVLVTTGMGPVNAKAAAARFLSPSAGPARALRDNPVPDAVIISGFAGSLRPSIAEGDVVIYENCLSATEKQDSISCSAMIVESATRLLRERGLESKAATGISSARIAQLDCDREALAGTGADVVDMESFEIAACSAAAGVPVAVIRAISDSPGSKMPDLNRALNSAGGFNRWALAWALGPRPLAAIRLIRASSRATATLERALSAILSSRFLGIVPDDMPAGYTGSSSPFHA